MFARANHDLKRKAEQFNCSFAMQAMDVDASAL
jgi:hypothetical protein